MQNDIVNHPSHYESGKFECIDVMEETQGKDAVMNFCLCNALNIFTDISGKMALRILKRQSGT